MTFAQKLEQFTKRKSFKYGLPFLICIVGGSFALKEFTQIRYQFAKKQYVSAEEMKKYGVSMKAPKEVTIEKEYEKVQSIDIDHWENKRGPRPWEENLPNK